MPDPCCASCKFWNQCDEELGECASEDTMVVLSGPDQGTNCPAFEPYEKPADGVTV